MGMNKLKRVGIIIMIITLTAILCSCYSNIKIDDSHYDNVSRTLTNPNATPKTKGLMNFLADNYGDKVFSGQYINEYEKFYADRFRVDPTDPNSPMTVFKANELQAIKSVTDKYSAILGLDISEIEVENANFSIPQALEWDKNKGIVTMCWHWKAPSQDPSKNHFYTEQTDFNLKKALKNKDSAEYKGLIKDIDFIAAELKALADADVPILWRPLHEASGGWFWWGASGAKAYKELWSILYDRMTDYHKLNNLIWVYNGQKDNWYVGDDKCDIVGEDPYYADGARSVYEKDTANALRFKKLYSTVSTKMIAMTENDFIFDIDAAFEKNTKWLMFCTWAREFVCEPDTIQQDVDINGNLIETWAKMTPKYRERYTSIAEIKKIYADSRVITLSDMQAYGGYY